VLRRICGPPREKVVGEWRKLQKEELRDLFFVLASLMGVKYVAHMKDENV
jgi:hypothetical protein